MSFKIWLRSTLAIGCLLPLSVFASSVSAVKNKQVVITMDSETYNVGDVIYGMTGSKKTALIQIQKIKGNKALGVITRGHVAVGGATMTRPAKTHAAKASSEDNGEDEYNPKSTIVRTRKKWSGGVLGSYSMQSASMTITSGVSESAKFTGSAMGLKGFVDYDYTPTVTIRGAFGLEPLNTKASLTNPLCNGSTACTFQYNFIALEAAIHYNFITSPSRYWVGAGYSLLFDGGHTNNTPNIALTGSAQMLLFGVGADFALKKGFIPVALEYGMFPGNGSATITSIFFRGGYGWNF